MDIKLLTGLIAATTSIITVVISFLLRNRIDKQFYLYKVKVEYEYEQRKKIKEVLAKYKTHLINAADALKGRLTNISRYYEQGDLNVNGDFLDRDNHYFQSTIYRILSFLSWISILDKELIFLDTTIATKEDLYFIKYLRAMKRVLQTEYLFDGITLPESKDKKQVDVIYRDTLEELSLVLIKNEHTVISFTEFKENIDNLVEKYLPLCRFIDGISPSEERKRWDRLYCLYVSLMSFLNSYGYDFQYSDEKAFKTRVDGIKKYELFPNLITHITKYNLEKEKEVAKVIDYLRSYIR